MAQNFPFILVVLTAVSALAVDSSMVHNSHLDFAGFSGGGGVGGAGGELKPCNGLGVGECIKEEELMLESDTVQRRSLAAQKGRYISYAAMRRDSVPCPEPGTSYYQCGRATQVNPYRRGCSKITHCWRSLG